MSGDVTRFLILLKAVYGPAVVTAVFLFRHFKVVSRLKIEPEFGRSLEISAKAKSRIGCNAAPAMHDIMNAGGWNIEVARQSVLADAIGLS